VKILIADDHALVREGLRQILEEAFPDATFAGAGTTPETLERLREGPWDVLLLDIFMPGRSGLEVLQAVQQLQRPPAVLVLSSAPEDQLAVRVLQAGAAGYLNKQAAPEELLVAVKKVLAGGRYVSPTLAENLATRAAHAPDPPHQRLSDREFQVLQLLVAGKSLKAIAAELALSPKTISTFHTRILEKLRIQNDVQLVHYALEYRLVERPVPPPSSDAL
jgi:two-component system, NarL family, invasion response regulator UvrY